MRIIIMGPPGVGKGTQSEFLVKHLQIPHISTGNIFRELYEENSTIGKIAQEYISRGELVPNDITNEIVKQRLKHKDVEKGFLFDGYPRNIEQAEALDQILEGYGWKLDAIISIEAPDELVVSRIAGRRVCPKCGTIYHVSNRKPKVEGICDIDGTKLIHRNDDMPQTVRRRLRIYNDQTAAVIGYYEGRKELYKIDGSRTINDTHNDVMKAIGEDT
jgi:adenylate kinase